MKLQISLTISILFGMIVHGFYEAGFLIFFFINKTLRCQVTIQCIPAYSSSLKSHIPACCRQTRQLIAFTFHNHCWCWSTFAVYTCKQVCEKQVRDFMTEGVEFLLVQSRQRYMHVQLGWLCFSIIGCPPKVIYVLHLLRQNSHIIRG